MPGRDDIPDLTDLTDPKLADDEWIVSYEEVNGSIMALAIALTLAIRRLVPEDQWPTVASSVVHYFMKEFVPEYLEPRPTN